MRVDSFPAPGAKIYASDYVVTGGGCAANAAVTVARIAGAARYAGPLGDEKDEASRILIASLERENIDCTGVLRVPGGSASVSLILLDATGEKEIATRRGQRIWRIRRRGTPPRWCATSMRCWWTTASRLS